MQLDCENIEAELDEFRYCDSYFNATQLTKYIK